AVQWGAFVIDEDFVMFVIFCAGLLGQGPGAGVRFAFRQGGVQIEERRLGVVLHDLFFLLLAFQLGLGFGGDLEAFDLVFGAAAGFGLLFGDQSLAVGKGDLVIIGMNFRKGEKALAVAAIFDKGGLQRRFDPR